jgi:hypothetical protein
MMSLTEDGFSLFAEIHSEKAAPGAATLPASAQRSKVAITHPGAEKGRHAG